MSSKLSVCFGASLIITGVFNFIFETNNIILLGMNLSALIFSLINFCILIFYKHIKSDRIEFIYILPFVILLFFCCFSESLKNIPFINNLSSSKILNAITFISFGLVFISEHANYKKDKKNLKNISIARCTESMDYSSLILDEIINYRNSIQNNNTTMDAESGKFLFNIERLCMEKIKKSKIEAELLEKDKDEYTLFDFSEAYTNNVQELKYDEE